ncbi:MAG: hypothetical protein CME64_08255 [Halobacteriovoraceae bacterium]|nr:hypothetical protein [Halobacteriovoraceae bacterium]|tara:strand:- start:138 stop:989 length:852 start_codon:yes stop_codon:yes gene_type:complete
MLQIGKVNKLIVNSKGTDGYSLRPEASEEQVFLPLRHAPKELKIGEKLEVFVYLDTNTERLLASGAIPKAQVGEYACLQVVEAPEFGAFLDWGMEKDLLVPGNEQKVKLRVDDWALVKICLEEGTNRIYGTTKLGKHLEATDFDIEENSKVDIVPVQHSDLGYRTIINKKYLGMLYKSEVFQQIELDKRYRGYVKKIRQDGLVDVALQPQGARNLFESKDKVLLEIKKHGGKIPLTDKSSPEDIYEMFAMSKKTFKAAVGMLYKDRKIVINKDSIELAGPEKA